MPSTVRFLLGIARSLLGLAALAVLYFGIRSYWSGDEVSRIGYVGGPDCALLSQRLWSHRGKILLSHGTTHVFDESGVARPVYTQAMKVTASRTRPDAAVWGLFGPQFPEFVDHWHGFNFGRTVTSRRIWQPDFTIASRGAPNATRTSRVWIVGVPHWFLVLTLGAWPAASFVRWCRHRHRARAGQCTRCGYDLRSTPDRCPECGWTAAAPLKPTA